LPKRTRGIRKHGARVLLSDILPYELPPSFNNRGFYDFVQRNGVRLTESGPTARRGDAMSEALLHIAFGRRVSFPAGTAPGASTVLDFTGKGKGKERTHTIPFQFTVRHRANDYRTLTVPHPAAQLDVVDFYDQNADLILYHTAKSHFTLRRPARVARYSITRDWVFERSRREHPDQVEEDAFEYEWLRSYFTYRRYSNIYKFYDSAQYRECERRFGFLVKVDIAKCFDSIYTHSLAWATDGHDVMKANLGNSKKMRVPFGDEFDRLMQRLNHNETSGITIGSEVSRVFAEIILQAVDVEVQATLQERGLIFGEDYEILRYVDDYFIFLAHAERRTEVVDLLAEKLRKYKLHLNASKEEGENTPWLSPLSSAKRRVLEMVREHVRQGEHEPDSGKLPSPFVNTAALIVGYKSILLDTGVSHFDLANWTLLRCERAMEKLLRTSQARLKGDVSTQERNRHAHQLSSALLYMLDFAFFVYSGAPRMSPAVKIARVVSSVLRFSRQDAVARHDRERIEMRVRQELAQQLRRSSRSEPPSVVTATLIDCISDLGDGYLMDQAELAEWCGFTIRDGRYQAPSGMNALLLFSIMLHIRDHSGYRKLRGECMRWAVEVQDRDAADAERALLALNLLTCPWVSKEVKDEVLRKYGYRSHPGRRPATGWNVDWTGFDLYSALQNKRLYEVY
jgi:hypothetical protein